MLRRMSLLILVVGASLLVATLAVAQSGYNNQCCYEPIITPCVFNCEQKDLAGLIYIDPPYVKTISTNQVFVCEPRHDMGYDSTNCEMVNEPWDPVLCATLKYYWDYSECVADVTGELGGDASWNYPRCRDTNCP